MIDVSQSVEHDHPRSLEFLRMDIKNVTNYFQKKGVTTLQERTAFEFITDEAIATDRDDMTFLIEKMMNEEQNRHDAEVDERVFRQAYIPKNLFEVTDPERDVGIIQSGGKDDLIYAKFLDVQDTKSSLPEVHANQEYSATSDEENLNSDEDESSDEPNDGPSNSRGKRHEDKDAKKVVSLTNIFLIIQERKQKVKEEARERRKHKIPKSEKKRKIKLTKKGK